MILSNKPKKSKYQVGDIVYFLNNIKGDSADVIKVVSIVSNPAEDSAGAQENIYYLKGHIKAFNESELFHSMNSLMFEIKGDYLNKWGNSEQITLDSGDVISYSDFSYCILSDENLPTNFSGIDLTGCNFEGSNLKGGMFYDSTLTECSFRYADLTGTLMVNSNISNADFRGTNLSHATLPSNANTKSSFKSKVGAGHWDAETTIWIDGNPIG